MKRSLQTLLTAQLLRKFYLDNLPLIEGLLETYSDVTDEPSVEGWDEIINGLTMERKVGVTVDEFTGIWDKVANMPPKAPIEPTGEVIKFDLVKALGEIKELAKNIELDEEERRELIREKRRAIRKYELSPEGQAETWKWMQDNYNRNTKELTGKGRKRDKSEF